MTKWFRYERRGIEVKYAFTLKIFIMSLLIFQNKFLCVKLISFIYIVFPTISAGRTFHKVVHSSCA